LAGVQQQWSCINAQVENYSVHEDVCKTPQPPPPPGDGWTCPHRLGGLTPWDRHLNNMTEQTARALKRKAQLSRLYHRAAEEALQ